MKNPTKPQLRVLAVMADGKPRRGFEIGLDAGVRTVNLYRMLNVLLDARWIIGQRSHDPFYRITDAGRAALGSP